MYPMQVRDCGLASKKSKWCKAADCDNVFVATNFEEAKDGELADTNDDLALLRFEFLEALTRVSLLKYGKDQGINDVSDSIQVRLPPCALDHTCTNELPCRPDHGLML